jgi:tetratricopeptide (TPR) repeat protein
MIVKDEAELLPRCLASVQAWVDEIVVVDTGSTDRTMAIAREYGAQVYSFQWCHDFAATRNESLKYATGDWILVLDADETLVPEIAPALKQVMQLDDVLVVNLLRQEEGTNLPYSSISRLFRNHPAIAFSRPYHELIDDSVAGILQKESIWRVVQLPGVAILHTGYQMGTIAQRRKIDRARTIMEAYLANHPNDSYICSKLGALYVDMGEAERGLELLQRGLQTDDRPVLYELHYHLGSTYQQLQQWQQAEEHYQAAIAQPIPATLKLGACTNLGDLLLQRGELTEAHQLFQTVVKAAPHFAPGYLNLGLALKAMGDMPGAIAHYQQAIALNPDYADAHQSLGVALLKVGQVLESMVAFRKAIALHEANHSPEAERLRGGLRELGMTV